jgi:hypothetical protein
MHYPEDQHDLLVVQDVVHDSLVANPQAMERVGGPVDRLDGLPADPTGCACTRRELLERRSDPTLDIRI